jgi:hypothetical protein
VLLSPTSVDTTTWPGSVSPLPSSGGETDGFAEQFSSADSALTEETLPLQTAGAGNGISDSAVIRGSAASAAARAQTFAITSDQSAPATARRGGLGTMDVNDPRFRLGGNRPDASPGKTVKNVTPNDAQAKGSTAATIQTLLPIPSGTAKDAVGLTTSTLAASALVTPALVTPASINSDAATMARRTSWNTGTQPTLASTSGILLNESFPRENPAAFATPALPMAGTGDESTEELAFAVKVQPARLMGPASRNSVGDSRNAAEAPLRQTSGGKAAATDSENADSPQDSEAGSATQARDNGADQSSATANDGTAKEAIKKSAATEIPQQDTPSSNGLAIVQADTTGDGVSRSTTGVAGKSTSSTASGPAKPDDVAPPDQSSAPTAPMKDISVRVQSVQGQNVDVRIVQRAGDLQVAVRSADSDTTQGLRHGLSELSSRLNESGYHAETWRPANSGGAGSGNSSQQPPSGDSQSNPGWSGQNRGQRDNNPSNRPHWVQELESKLANGTESTGQFHGLIS